jgi:hypothetical protein
VGGRATPVTRSKIACRTREAAAEVASTRCGQIGRKITARFFSESRRGGGRRGRSRWEYSGRVIRLRRGYGVTWSAFAEATAWQGQILPSLRDSSCLVDQMPSAEALGYSRTFALEEDGRGVDSLIPKLTLWFVHLARLPSARFPSATRHGGQAFGTRGHAARVPPKGGVKKIPRKALTPQLMVCYLLRRHYALSQVWVS